VPVTTLAGSVYVGVIVIGFAVVWLFNLMLRKHIDGLNPIGYLFTRSWGFVVRVR
jgi:hypothetical protein